MGVTGSHRKSEVVRDDVYGRLDLSLQVTETKEIAKFREVLLNFLSDNSLYSFPVSVCRDVTRIVGV